MTARERLSEHKRIVVKVGTTTLTYPNGQLNFRRIEKICLVLSDLCNQGKEMILVTSGAIAVGADCLRLDKRPRDILGKQAASAVGQAMLMQIYQRFFSVYNRQIAQILLTGDVLENPQRMGHASNTINTLIGMGVVPIVNANDTIATEELDEISDNDTLSAHVAVLSESDMLIMLSDIEGLYNADPRTAPQAAFYYEVHSITPEMEGSAGGSGSALGTGGMATKLTAARMVMDRGMDAMIASGEDPEIIWKILKGEQTGTLFTNI
jgi:glutamate 5-kinase